MCESVETEKWRSRYLKRGEVALRNRPEECWVIIRGVVRDLTPLIEEYWGMRCVRPLLAEAGKDISHWFDDKGELLTYIHPVSGVELPYLPHGEIPHLCDEHRASPCWFSTPLPPWWRDKRYFVGKITQNERPIKIMNMLTKFTAKFTVCEEDTLGGKISERYKPYNWALESYAWKYDGRLLDMEKTLTENGIPDLRQKLRSLDLPDNLYTPCICLYYKDDFN